MPKNELYHIYGIFIYDTIKDKDNMEHYIKTYRLKRYIDKYMDIDNIDKYLAYIRKNLTSTSKYYVDYYFFSLNNKFDWNKIDDHNNIFLD